MTVSCLQREGRTSDRDTDGLAIFTGNGDVDVRGQISSRELRREVGVPTYETAQSLIDRRSCERISYISYVFA